MKNCLLLLSLFLTIVACSKDDDTQNDVPSKPYDRTVLIYMSAENSLSDYVREELEELKAGSKGLGNNALVVYVDVANGKNRPYIAEIKEGNLKVVSTLSNDPTSSDPETMKSVLNYTSKHFPAQEYGLVLWGHASGWLFKDSVATAGSRLQVSRSSTDETPSRPLRAFGIDSGNNSYSDSGLWINMPTLASVLSDWKHLRFILADCCQFQCIESAYELRNTTDYIIASPAEIPNCGAPYDKLTKYLFEQSDTFYQPLVDCYFNQVIQYNNTITYNNGWSHVYYRVKSRTPLSVIKTTELARLADSTRVALHVLNEQWGHQLQNLNTQKLIYYNGTVTNLAENVMYDMNDVLLHNTDSATYSHWKEAFDKAVVYKVNAKEGWMSSGQIDPYVFGQDRNGNQTGTTTLTDERYGGVSMFIPQQRQGTPYLPSDGRGGYNQDIKRTSWYYAAGLNELGW